MKIGILTYPLNNNYGNLLQIYALMTVLKRMGHEVWLLDIRRSNQQSIFRKYISFIKRTIKTYLLKKDICVIPHKDIRQYELNAMVIEQYSRFFIDKYLCPKISPLYSSEELKYIIDKIHFDVFIVGSDQIWRPKLIKSFLKTTYFDFLQGKNVKRISYAASFGTNEWEYSLELTQECAELIKKFKAVSVREESGITMCKKHLNVDAQWVLDPTMLLDKENYIELIDNNQTKQSDMDLFCYILDKTDEKQNLIDHIATHLALTPFHMGLRINEISITNKVFEPIETWLREFQETKFVITDSFHGMVFSIIFNKPFLCIVNEKRGGDRFISLAKLFGLEDRLILEDKLLSYSDTNICLLKLNTDINWDSVNAQMNTKKIESLHFLIENLG